MYRLDKKELSLRQETRGCYPEGAHWYAVMVHCGQEDRIRTHILEDLFDLGVDEVLLPLVRQAPNASGRDLKTPPEFLFRSYLFLRCEMNDRLYISLCDHRSVYQILGRAYRIPAVLDDQEILRLRQILDADCRPEMISRRNIGALAHIVEGPMAGVHGRVLAVNSKEVKMEVSFSFLDMGTSVALVVPRSDVRIKESVEREYRGERMCHA